MAKNLERLKLVDCPSLTEVPSSLQYLDKLEYIDLSDCYNLRSFPMLDSKVLSFLYISRCLDVTTCPTISQNMVWLWLEQTSIKEVPQSVTGRLKYLYLNGCSKMTKFPENLEDIEVLELRGTAIKEVPSSIQAPIQFLTRLETLDMSGCSKLESFPEITVPMESLVELNLSKTGIKEIPSSSFKHMISLKRLQLDGTPIKALPELPPSLCYLTTHDCASLETAISIIKIRSLWGVLDFTNCFKLDQKPLVAAMHLKIQVSL
jgi:Leucine-rich repeat (LRR) protein